jgi:hypothetical protein
MMTTTMVSMINYINLFTRTAKRFLGLAEISPDGFTSSQSRISTITLTINYCNLL